MTPGAKQTLQRAAAVAKRSVTDFVMESALASAAALDAPPKLHPRLARLLQQPSGLEQAQAVDAG
jgi:uncharacterized protein (DUF1778 family)